MPTKVESTVSLRFEQIAEHPQDQSIQCAQVWGEHRVVHLFYVRTLTHSEQCGSHDHRWHENEFGIFPYLEAQRMDLISPVPTLVSQHHSLYRDMDEAVQQYLLQSLHPQKF